MPQSQDCGTFILQTVQELADLAAGGKDMDGLILMFCKDLMVPGTVLFIELPDPAGHLWVEPFVAAFGHILSGVAPVFDDTADPAPKANDTRKV